MKYSSVFPVSWSKAVYASLGRNRPLSTPSFALSVWGAHQMSIILVFHMAAFWASLSSGVLSRPMSWLQLKQLIRMQHIIATPRRENSVALRTVFFSFSFISSSFFFLILILSVLLPPFVQVFLLPSVRMHGAHARKCAPRSVRRTCFYIENTIVVYLYAICIIQRVKIPPPMNLLANKEFL